MKAKVVLLILIITALAVYFYLKPTNSEPSYSFCGVRLNSISKNSGYAGESILLFGKWGNKQGEKIIAMNKGSFNNITAASWSNSTIEIKVPSNMPPGKYKIGVYCNNPHAPEKGGSYSSGWLDFHLINKY